jgi:hypothetical protein
MKKLEKTFKSI